MKTLFLLLFVANITLSQTFVTIKDVSGEDRSITVYKALLMVSLKDEIAKNPKLTLKDESNPSTNSISVEILIATTDQVNYSVNANFFRFKVPHDLFLTNWIFISSDYSTCAKLIYAQLINAISKYDIDLQLPPLPASFEEIK